MGILYFLLALTIPTILLIVGLRYGLLPWQMKESVEAAQLKEFDAALVKKYSAINTQSLRPYTLIAGFFITFLAIIAAVEFKSFEEEPPPKKMDAALVTEEIMDIPITEMPPPEPPKPKTTTVIKEVEDEELLEEEPLPLDTLEEEADPYYEEEEEIIEEIPEPEPPKVYFNAEINAEPNGGLMAFDQFIIDNIHVPQSDIDAGNQGMVMVSFLVLENGSLSSFKVEQGVSPTLDAEVVRVLKSSPRWSPGKIQGQSIRQQIMHPVMILFD